MLICPSFHLATQMLFSPVARHALVGFSRRSSTRYFSNGSEPAREAHLQRHEKKKEKEKKKRKEKKRKE
jgi:hypothetical protein